MRRPIVGRGPGLFGALARRLRHWLTYRPERHYMRGHATAATVQR
jgi:hypothetical protein